MATLGACGDERPEDRKAEQKRAKKVHKFNEIGEMPITMVAYPGCIEGDRVPVSVKGDDRAVLLFGTADMIARYVIGEEVALPKKGIEKLNSFTFIPIYQVKVINKGSPT